MSTLRKRADPAIRHQSADEPAAPRGQHSGADRHPRDDPRADLLTPIWRDPREMRDLTPRQWERLLGQARQTRLISRLARCCSDLDAFGSIPPGARRHLTSSLRWVERQGHEVRWEIDCIRRALTSVDTPVVLLKGAAYLAAELPPARARLFNDIDILVDRRRISQVEDALFAGGWISAERDAYNQRYYRQWMHELPPLRHVTRRTVIDVHHTIAPPTSRFRVDGAALLERIRPLAAGSRLSVLDPADMVLHSAVHLFQEGEFDHGLRDLLDLDDLLRHFGATDPLFWARLMDRARMLGLSEPLHHALQQAKRLFGTTPPPEAAAAVRALRPGPVARIGIGWLFARALRPRHPSCDRWTSRLARSVLYLRSHRLRMPMHLMLPHLLRKAWMRRFPTRTGAPEGVA